VLHQLVTAKIQGSLGDHIAGAIRASRIAAAVHVPHHGSAVSRSDDVTRVVI
jgi:hypothetical protein